VTKSRGYVIVLVYTIFVNILRWSIGYNLMKPEAVRKNSITLGENSKDEIITGSYNKIVMSGDEETEVTRRNSIEKVEEDKSWGKVLKESINVPFVSGIVAIVLASLPYVGSYLSSPDSVAFNLLISNIYLTIEPCEAIGNCSSIFVILILGINLSQQNADHNDNGKLSG
jgi:predicted permease